MNQKMNLLLIAALVILLAVSQAAYCEDSCIEIKLEGRCNDEGTHCTCPVEAFSILLEGESPKFTKTVYLVVPLDVKIESVLMKLSPMREEILINVAMKVGDKIIFDYTGEFTAIDLMEEKYREKLMDSLWNYLEANQEEEAYEIRVPFVFTSDTKGTINCSVFSIGYTVNTVEGLKTRLDSRGIPEYFSWKPSKGSNPKYVLEIRSDKNFSTKSEALLMIEENFAGTCYTLADYDKFDELEKKFRNKKTYYYGVRVVYDSGHSAWVDGEFIVGQKDPYEIGKIDVDTTSQNVIRFSWNNPGNADFYKITLNGYLCKERYPKAEGKTTEYIIYLDSEDPVLDYLCFYGENRITVWAMREEGESGPESRSFGLGTVLKKPWELYPNCRNIERDRSFTFSWTGPEGAEKYKIQLFDASGKEISLPYIEDGETKKGKTAIIDKTEYNPWSRKYKEQRGLKLTPGEIYTWQVRAVPEQEPMEYIESEWAIQMFIYEPVPQFAFIVLSAVGGVLGGFYRISREERRKTEKKNGRMKRPPLDYQTGTDLLIGILIGVVLYLMISRSLINVQIGISGIPPFDIVGSFIVGLIGGVISYDFDWLRVFSKNRTRG
jgi:hypothetical protein